MQSDTPPVSFMCPDCGSDEIESNWKPPAYSLKCAKCSWAVFTTRFPPIFGDATIYRVFLIPEGSNIVNSIRTIKQLYGETTPGARRLLTQPQIFLFEGKAVKLFGKIESLTVDGLKLQIEPPFKYTRTDLMGMYIA
jgi:hypothetical protein